ncbi:MAG TPA: UMP kinase [Bacteroidales bacterium]|nr:UMP kinase [Bacteroidales bacterium]
MPTYKRVLLKLSGEALMGDDGYGINSDRLTEYAEQIKEINELGVQIAIVIGGGNIFRGMKGTEKGFDRVKGDYMGMLATVINGLAIQSALESLQVKARLLTAIRMEPVGQGYSKQQSTDALNNQEVVIFTAGTGNPFFTTDTASALRAVEIEADALLKGTRVDGVYTADPEKDPTAEKFDEITFDEAYNRGLSIMDLTAFTMCRENNLPVVVFDMNKTGNLKKLILGEKIGTLVKK